MCLTLIIVFGWNVLLKLDDSHPLLSFLNRNKRMFSNKVYYSGRRRHTGIEMSTKKFKWEYIHGVEKSKWSCYVLQQDQRWGQEQCIYCNTKTSNTVTFPLCCILETLKINVMFPYRSARFKEQNFYFKQLWIYVTLV